MIGAFCVREEWGRLSAQRQSQYFDFEVIFVIIVYHQGFLVYRAPLQHDIKHHHLTSSRILQVETDPKSKIPRSPFASLRNFTNLANRGALSPVASPKVFSTIILFHFRQTSFVPPLFLLNRLLEKMSFRVMETC